MPYTYDHITDFHRHIENEAGLELQRIENELIKGRDKHNIPIYLTRCRVKTPDSIYLKAKRKNYSSLTEIPDLAAMRVLCLFSQDIIPVNEFILKTMNNSRYILDDFEIYNWDESASTETIFGEAAKFKNGIEKKIERKNTGYKSIHYVFKNRDENANFQIEIQLRTLLQDVWGELEHALSYKKGDINPHIRSSFKLLARELETKDILMSHLRTISDKENEGFSFAVIEAGPKGYFSYEDDKIPSKFKNGHAKTEFNQFIELLKHINEKPNGAIDLSEAKEKLKTLLDCYKAGEAENDPNYRYFRSMEKAYFDFFEHKYEKAIKPYEQITEDKPDYYVPHFRLGELYFILGENVQALKEFDKCNDLLTQKRGPKDVTPDHLNKFEINKKVAYTYWLLGDEYIKFSVDSINKAELVYEKHKKDFSREDYVALLNSKCAYLLYDYIIEQRKADELRDKTCGATELTKQKTKATKALGKAKTYLKKLESGIKGTSVSSNIYDTLAWFYYQIYLRDQNQENLKKAKNFCKEIWNNPNKATLKMTSRAIHINHTLEILNTK